MRKPSDLLAAVRTDQPVDTFLASVGRVFRVFDGHDSGCVSYGVAVGEQRFFVKHADTSHGLASLGRAERLHATVRHVTVPRLRHAFDTPGGRALVYDWSRGEVLYDAAGKTGAAARAHPMSAHARFRALPTPRVLAALDAVYDAHLEIASRGFVAVDLYDGCVLYDFERHATRLCDLDEYREGAFVLEAERLPGSTRFMAPEEFCRGAVIDARTNVFTLGRLAAVLLFDADVTAATRARPRDLASWHGDDDLRRVVLRATGADRATRYASVEELVRAWRAAVGRSGRA